jgi:hypothetical protein
MKYRRGGRHAPTASAATNIVTAAVTASTSTAVQSATWCSSSRVNFTGRTSIEVGVRVEAEDLSTGVVTPPTPPIWCSWRSAGAGRCPCRSSPEPTSAPLVPEAAERRRKRLAERRPADD